MGAPSPPGKIDLYRIQDLCSGRSWSLCVVEGLRATRSLFPIKGRRYRPCDRRVRSCPSFGSARTNPATPASGQMRKFSPSARTGAGISLTSELLKGFAETNRGEMAVSVPSAGIHSYRFWFHRHGTFAGRRAARIRYMNRRRVSSAWRCLANHLTQSEGGHHELA